MTVAVDNSKIFNKAEMLLNLLIRLQMILLTLLPQEMLAKY